MMNAGRPGLNVAFGGVIKLMHPYCDLGTAASMHECGKDPRFVGYICRDWSNVYVRCESKFYLFI